MWFWVIIFSGLIGVIKQILNRLILKKDGDSLAFAFFYQLIGAASAIPFLLLSFKFPRQILPYFLLLLIGIVDTLPTFLTMESFKYLEISLRTIFSQTRMFWLLLFSALILNESLSFDKIIGVCLIFSGIAVAVFRKSRISRLRELFFRLLGRKQTREKGIAAVLSASFITALEMIGIKYLLEQFSVPLVIFVIYLISSFVFLYLRPEVKKRLVVLIKGPQRRVVWLTGLCGSASVLLGFWAVSMTEVSRASPVFQSFAVLTVLAGIVFLKEREGIWQKIAGGILAAIGVVFIKSS